MRKKGFKLVFIFLAISGLLVFLYFTNIFSPVKEKIYQALNPVAFRLYSLSSNISGAYRSQAEKIDFSKKINELEKEVSELKVKNAELSEAAEENRRLREHLDFLDEKKFRYEMAHVISKGFASSPEESEKDIIIDRGSIDGLFSGLAVVNSQGVLVGKILRVEERVSRVSLSSNSECRLAATIQGLDRTIGIASGKLGLTISMGFISQDEDIKKGDLVVTSGLEENIPRGILIGEVSRLEGSSNDIWKNAVIESLANFDDLIIVSVILP